MINNLENFYLSREEAINFFRDYGKMALMHPTNQNMMKLREQDLRY